MENPLSQSSTPALSITAALPFVSCLWLGIWVKLFPIKCKCLFHQHLQHQHLLIYFKDNLSFETMYFSNFLPVAALLSLHISSSLALPTTTTAEEPHQIEARAAGSSADPHLLDIDCKGVEEVCEAQCLAIHCFNSPAIMYVKYHLILAHFSHNLGNTILAWKRPISKQVVPKLSSAPAK